MSLFQLRFSASPDQVEVLEDLFFELEGGEHWNVFLSLKEQAVTVSGVFKTAEAARENWQCIRSFVEEAVGHPVEIAEEELDDQSWQESYKEHFQPWSHGSIHWVPEWLKESYELPEGHAALYLDPGMAFGTGNHETTRLCVVRLVEWLAGQQESGKQLDDLTVCDAGCGSGILALSAYLLGLHRVEGFDYDPDSVRISEENAEKNGMSGAVAFYEADLDSGFKDETYDLVLANILAAVLEQYPERLINTVKPGGCLVLSGILAKEAQALQEKFEAVSAKLGRAGRWESRELGEWADVVFYSA